MASRPSTRPYPERGQLWVRVDRRYCKEPVVVQVISVSDGVVLLETQNLQKHQKLNTYIRSDLLRLKYKPLERRK